jgi:hypothetical protein
VGADVSSVSMGLLFRSDEQQFLVATGRDLPPNRD